MTTQHLPARSAITALADLDAQVRAHGDAMPYSSWPETPAQTAARRDWYSRGDALHAERDRVLTEVRSLLCWKCEGRGVTQWRHRLGGVCYSCKGDGWSVKGRKAARAGL